MRLFDRLPLIEYQVESHFRAIRLGEEFKWSKADQADRKHSDDTHSKIRRQRTLYDLRQNSVRIKITAPCECPADQTGMLRHFLFDYHVTDSRYECQCQHGRNY